MMARGYNNKGIAQKLGLGRTTVKNHISVIYQQYHLTRKGLFEPRVQAVLLFLGVDQPAI